MSKNEITGNYNLFIPGTPRPQGSMQAIVSKSTGRAFMKSSSTTVQWRNVMVGAFTEQMGVGAVGIIPGGPVWVSLTFEFARPKSHPKKRAAVDLRVKYNGSDIDKLTRAVLDAMTVAGVIGDDTQVAFLEARKRYSPNTVEGVRVLWGQAAGGYKKADGSFV